MSHPQVTLQRNRDRTHSITDGSSVHGLMPYGIGFLPSVVVDPRSVAVVDGHLVLCREAKGDKREGYDMYGDAQQASYSRDAFFSRIDAEPNRSQAFSIGCDQDVLSRGRAILDPKVLVFGQCRIAADEDGQWRGSQHLRIVMDLRDRIERLPVSYHDEVPGSFVACRRGRHGR